MTEQPQDSYDFTTPLEAGVLPGVTKGTIEKIKAAGVTTVEALGRQTKKKLSELAGIGADTAEGAIEKAVNYTSKGFITGDALALLRGQRTHLTTGSEEVNQLLGGGIESQTTTELSGTNGSGKTQMCHMLAITAQLPVAEGGLGGEVAWIDTEDTFRPERIMEICRERGLDGEEFVKRIHIGRALTSVHQAKLTHQLFELVPDNNIKLIIMDSMMGHLRSEYLGREMLSARQDALKGILQTLMQVALSTKTTVVYTNQMLANPVLFGGNKPTGGHVMGHAATMRLEVRKGRNENRVMKLTKSPYLPEGEAQFLITGAGVEDTEKYKKVEEEDE